MKRALGEWLPKSRYADAALAGMILLIVGMMVVPLPTFVLDILISSNMALSVIMLLTAVYGRQGLGFASMPSALLIATLYRLALNVSSTRLILLQADAGRVIASFGQFVVRGDYIVGGVIFIILTIIQFLVIAKGAERVAEVGARFSLDAMPGKQLAIDSEVRSGALGHEQARAARRALARESQFYGAMDGAMKFVKGDAIASILIIAIDLLAGVFIGVVVRELSILDSLRVYGLLTIGDGLSSQLPALLISTAAGIVVTRVAGAEDRSSLGFELSRQLLGEPQVLRMAGLFLAVLAFIPGLPLPPFLLLAALCTVASFVVRTAAEEPAEHALSPRLVPLKVSLHTALHRRIAELLQKRRVALQERVFAELGLPMTRPQLYADSSIAERGYRIEILELPAASGVLDESASDEVLCEQLEGALRSAVKAHAAELLDLQQVQQLLDTLERSEPARVRNIVPAILSLSDMLELLRRLLREAISIRPLGEIIELAASERTKDVNLPVAQLYERLRSRMARRICHEHAREGGLFALTLDPLIESTLEEHVLRSGAEPRLALPPDLARDIVEATRTRVAEVSAENPVLLTSAQLRPLVRELLSNSLPNLCVLGYNELAPELSIRKAPPISP